MNNDSNASYKCPYCKKLCEIEQSHIKYDGQEINDFCQACDEQIKIKVTLITILEAQKVVSNE